MERKKILKGSAEKKRILVAPLDWGLGHATRSIPLIIELLNQNVDVVLAADGRPYDLLQREFPSLPIVRLSGYGIRYSEDGNIVSEMLRQLPRIAASVIREHRTLSKLIKDLKIDAVISDNRFGLFSRCVPCIYVTHQIAIRMPRSLEWFSRTALMMHELLIRRYDECWIPDHAEEANLSGSLSHGFPLPANARYIGPLSRFKTDPNAKLDYDVVAVLSGPEPQRTIFEGIIVEQLRNSQWKSLVVRGVPEKSQHMKLSDSLSVVSFLESDALSRAMQSAAVIVARPGYSTLMDLALIGRQAILVPTPGQTEQEYLANTLKSKGLFCIQEQENFDLKKALTQAGTAPGFSRLPSTATLVTEAVQRLIALIPNKVSVTAR